MRRSALRCLRSSPRSTGTMTLPSFSTQTHSCPLPLSFRSTPRRADRLTVAWLPNSEGRRECNAAESLPTYVRLISPAIFRFAVAGRQPTASFLSTAPADPGSRRCSSTVTRPRPAPDDAGAWASRPDRRPPLHLASTGVRVPKDRRLRVSPSWPRTKTALTDTCRAPRR